MSNPFLQQVNRDIQNVFLNTNENGKTIQWNGYPLTVVEDIGYRLESQLTHGVDKEVMRLICASNALEPSPKAYERVVIDDADWSVVSVAPAQGFLILTLETNRA